jgi:hypothetical protein
MAILHVLCLNKGQIAPLHPRHISINHIGGGSASTRGVIQILHHELPYDLQVLWSHTSFHHVRWVVRTWIILLRRIQYGLQRSRKEPDSSFKIILSEFPGDICGSLNDYVVKSKLAAVCGKSSGPWTIERTWLEERECRVEVVFTEFAQHGLFLVAHLLIGTHDDHQKASIAFADLR